MKKLVKLKAIGRKAIGKIAGIIAFTAIFAFSFIACGDDGGGGSADPDLNGTWNYSSDERMILDDGDFKYYYGVIESFRGTYSTSGSNITVNAKQVSGFALLAVPVPEANPLQWYDQQACKNLIVNYLVNEENYTRPVAESVFNSDFLPYFQTQQGTYQQSGNSLSITSNGILFKGTRTYGRP